MIKYSGIYESTTPPPSTKALWVDGGVLKIYKNGSWRPVDDPKSKLNIDSILKAGSTNPVENGAIHSRFIGVDKDIEVNRNNITNLTRRTDEIDGIAKGAEALAKVNEKNINSATVIAKQANELAQKNEFNLSQVQATANTALTNSRENQNGVRNAQVTANEAKASVEGLTIVTKRIEGDVSQLKELNVVYPNGIRNLTTETDADVVKEVFVPVIGGSTGEVNTPHVGYLIKGADVGPDSTGPDSTIISVDIVKIEDIDCHKFVYVDNNTAIISVTVDLVNYKVMDKSTLANIEATSKVGTLRDLYISAGAKYNEATGYYELNGLTDITEEEMRVIWQEDLSGWYQKGRTNLTRNISVKGNTGGYNGGIDIACICINNKNLQVFNLGANCFARYMDSTFRECSNLETIDTRFRVVPYDTSLGINTFRGCIKLKDVRFNNHYLRMKATLNLCDSPLISKESVLSAITTTDNASATSAGFLTITLHADAYARLNDDADIIAALEAKNGVVTLVSA